LVISDLENQGYLKKIENQKTIIASSEVLKILTHFWFPAV
jgi:hypothetical protein